MTDQNPIENNSSQENQPDNSAQGINFPNESVQLPEENTAPRNPALNIEPLSAAAVPDAGMEQGSALGGIVLKSAFESSEQASGINNGNFQNDIAQADIPAGSVPSADIPVLNPFDGLNAADSQNSEIFNAGQPEEAAPAAAEPAADVSASVDAFADLYNISGTQTPAAQELSASQEPENNVSNDGQFQNIPQEASAAPAADAFADLYSSAGNSDSVAAESESSVPAPELQPAFEMPAATETDNTAAAESGAALEETFTTPDHGFSFDGQESSVNEGSAEAQENTVAEIQPDFEISDNNTGTHEIPAISPITAETLQADENNLESLSAGIQETQPENTTVAPVLNEPQPEEPVNATENTVFSAEQANENTESITSAQAPEKSDIEGETPETEPVADVPVNQAENTENQNTAAETVQMQETANLESAAEAAVQETKETVHVSEQQVKEEETVAAAKTDTSSETPVEPAAEVKPEIAAAATAVQAQPERSASASSGSNAASYIVPTIAIMATAAFFFILGKKTAYMEKNQAATAPQEITASAETKDNSNAPAISDDVSAGSQQEGKNNDGISGTAENTESNIVSESADSGAWQKAEYSPEKKEALKFFYSEQERSIFPNKASSLLHYYIENYQVPDAENVIAVGLDSPNQAVGNLSPLQKAASMNEHDMCRMLLAYGADINYYNDKYPTPLTLAVAFRRPEIVKLLIENGADQTITFIGDDGKKHIALEIAEKGGFDEIIEVFKSSKANTVKAENNEAASAEKVSSQPETKPDSSQKK